jgi:hypothetical protein
MTYTWDFHDKGDGRLRLRRKTHTVRRFKDGKIQIRFKKPSQRLISSFSKAKLLKIAWKCDVTNPDGFDRGDAKFLGVSDKMGFDFYKTGWCSTKKMIIGRYIWNRLHDLHLTR